MAWPGQGSSEDKKEGTDADVTEEEETEGGAVCHRSTRGGRIKDGFEVAGTWDHSDQSRRWKVRGGTGLWGKLSNLVLDICSLNHMLCQASTRLWWAVGSGAERCLIGAPDPQTARPVELEWLPRPLCSYCTHPLHPDLA